MSSCIRLTFLNLFLLPFPSIFSFLSSLFLLLPSFHSYSLLSYSLSCSLTSFPSISFIFSHSLPSFPPSLPLSLHQSETFTYTDLSLVCPYLLHESRYCPVATALLLLLPPDGQRRQKHSLAHSPVCRTTAGKQGQRECLITDGA